MKVCGPVILRWLRILGRHLLGLVLYILGAWASWRVGGHFPWEHDQVKDVEGWVYTTLLFSIFTLSCIPAYSLMELLVWRKGRQEGKFAFLRPFLAGVIATGFFISILSAWPRINWAIGRYSGSFGLSEVMLFLVIPFLSVIMGALLVSFIPFGKRRQVDGAGPMPRVKKRSRY